MNGKIALAHAQFLLVSAVDVLDPDPFYSLDPPAGPASVFWSSANKHW